MPVAPGPTKVALIDVTLEESEGLLHSYQHLLSPGLPFVVLPNGATAQSLYEQRPVLLRAISTVALFHDLPRQQSLVKDLIRDVGERMLLKGEKSMDLLQGIVVLIGWFHPHIFWCHQLTNLIHLGISLTVELGLDRVPAQCQQENGRSPRIPTLAEHRVLLGLFYYTSMVSCAFNQRHTRVLQLILLRSVALIMLQEDGCHAFHPLYATLPSKYYIPRISKARKPRTRRALLIPFDLIGEPRNR